jgi:hypothetical protein
MIRIVLLDIVVSMSVMYSVFITQCNIFTVSYKKEEELHRGRRRENNIDGEEMLLSSIDHQTESLGTSLVNEVNSAAAMFDYGTKRNKKLSRVVRGTSTP